MNITCDICLCGVIYMLKYKKKLFGHFVVCLDPGTRQSDHLARLCTSLPCAKMAHGKVTKTSLCASVPGTRRSLNLCRVPWMPAHGKVGSQRRLSSSLPRPCRLLL